MGGSLFRSNNHNSAGDELSDSTRRWQGIRLGLTVLLMISGYFGMRHNTEPSPVLSMIALLMSAVMVFAVTLPAISIQSRQAHMGEGQKLIFLLIVLPVVGYLSWKAMTTFPIIFTTEEPVQPYTEAELVQIVRMGSAPCVHTAHIRFQRRRDKLCIHPNLSEQLKPGDSVTILVSESRLGNRYVLAARSQN